MEYIQFAFTGINILATAFLIMVMSYWVLIILGIFSFDVIEFDLDIDFSSNMYFDGGVETEDPRLEIGPIRYYFLRILKFLNLGSVPIIIYGTIFFLLLWVLSMLLYYSNISPRSIWGLLAFILNCIISAFITKGLTEPLKKFFSSMEDRSDIEIIGQSCILKSNLSSANIAQAEIIVDDYPIIINVKSLGESIIRGSRAIVISKDNKNEIYIVREQL
jgi:hypothetical protein